MGMPDILSLFALFALLASCNADCSAESFLGGKFSRCQSLNSIYTVYWNIVGNDLTLALHLQSTKNSWLGIGTSVNGGMRGADIAIARVEAGKYVLEDRFVPGEEGTPKLDDHQDLTLISASSDDSSTTVIFTRKLTPCDVDEDVPILEHETPIIFAYGTSFGYHGMNRGATSISFHYIPTVKSLPSDTLAVPLIFPTYQVPSKDTTYTCTPVELPYQNKSHIVRWRPNIKPGNEPYVHHMVIFTCPDPVAATSPYECGMAPAKCSNILIAWSLGQRGNDWLDDYALPIGGDTGVRYAVLQIHYNNPNRVQNIVDSSGIELYITQQLRKYDIGSLVITTKMSEIFIPAHTEDTEQSAECPSECTSKFPFPVTLVNYFPHMHQIGQKIWTQHIRNETEIAEIHRDNHYDFQRQQSYNVNVTILPGDRLIMHCSWNSTLRDANTTGGESSNQEMCVSILQYYPATTKFSSCSDSGTGKTASCGVRMDMAPYKYTALPAPMSTCNDDAAITGETGSTSTVVSQVIFFGVLLVVLAVVASVYIRPL